MYNDILIIGGDKSNISKYGISNFSLYKPIPTWLKSFRIFSLRTKIGLSLWQYKLEEVFVKKFKTIILFDCHEMDGLSEYIEKTVSSESRLILFYWNPIMIYSQEFMDRVSSRWEKWSFDYDDCKKYGFKYTGQLAFDKSIPEVECTNFGSDIFFIGIDKGRFKYLMLLEESLKKVGLNVDFRYVDNRKAVRDKRYSVACSYADMIQFASKTKCMLEINQKEQFGLTLRAVEAILLGKKLITNNPEIVKYNFYDSSRIYVIGPKSDIDDAKKIKAFIEMDIKPYPAEVKDRYRFSSWLTRILNNVELKDFNG